MIQRRQLEWSSKRSGLINHHLWPLPGGVFAGPRQMSWCPICHLVLSYIALVDDHARKLHMGHGISCHVEVLRPYTPRNCQADSKRCRAIRL